MTDRPLSILRKARGLALPLIFAPLLAAAAGTPLRVEAGGNRIEAFVHGQGTETLIMAAGNGRPAVQLDALAEGIAARGIRVVTYNYRSLGASTGPIDGLTLHDYAQDLWRLADALGAQKVHLAGKTYGNRVVRTAASDQPGRVLSVTLIGAGGEVMPSAETVALYKQLIDPTTSKADWLRLQGLLNYAPGHEKLAELDAAQGEFAALAAAQVKADAATPKSEWAQGGTAPMLVMTCLLDRVAPPQGALQIAQKRPNTWLVGFPNCGHNMLNEIGDELTRSISDFVLRAAAKR